MASGNDFEFFFIFLSFIFSRIFAAYLSWLSLYCFIKIRGFVYSDKRIFRDENDCWIIWQVSLFLEFFVSQVWFDIIPRMNVYSTFPLLCASYYVLW
jgi:hypothetical protein